MKSFRDVRNLLTTALFDNLISKDEYLRSPSIKTAVCFSDHFMMFDLNDNKF